MRAGQRRADDARRRQAQTALVRSRAAGVPDCLITRPARVAASSSTATADQTGRNWDSPTQLNTPGGAGPQIDAGASGQASRWLAPEALDTAAPLVAGFRPRLAAPGNGHAVVAAARSGSGPASCAERRPCRRAERHCPLAQSGLALGQAP